MISYYQLSGWSALSTPTFLVTWDSNTVISSGLPPVEGEHGY